MRLHRDCWPLVVSNISSFAELLNLRQCSRALRDIVDASVTRIDVSTLIVVHGLVLEKGARAQQPEPNQTCARAVGLFRIFPRVDSLIIRGRRLTRDALMELMVAFAVAPDFPSPPDMRQQPLAWTQEFKSKLAERVASGTMTRTIKELDFENCRFENGRHCACCFSVTNKWNRTLWRHTVCTDSHLVIRLRSCSGEPNYLTSGLIWYLEDLQKKARVRLAVTETELADVDKLRPFVCCFRSDGSDSWSLCGGDEGRGVC